MSQSEITRGVVNYFKSSQWQELMQMLTQTEEEIYHIHMYWENRVEAQSLSRLMERYFARKGLVLDRKIDLTSPKLGVAGLHSVHPHNPERSLYVPAVDMYWHYNPNVVLEPAGPDHGESGKGLIGWGKKYMDNYYKQFDFKCVGPNEGREIAKYFQSSHWKKLLRLVESGRYTHVHANLEINFDPWILEVFAIGVLKEIGWKMDHVIPCVYIGPGGKYTGKIVFLTAYPEEVWDFGWVYNPDVVIRPATFEFSGYLPEDGDISFDVWTHKYLNELLAQDKYESLTDEQIEEILNQV
ncbi:MAG: hypothetical protein V3V23_02780 [Dehalococcoidales bacterium]